MSKYQQLYRMFDKDDRLLYIGISMSALARLAQHAREQVWIMEVARVEIETRACTRQEIMDAELKAIRMERPLYNKAGVCGVRTPKRLSQDLKTWPTVKEMVGRVLAEYRTMRFPSKVIREWILAARPLLRVLGERRTDTLQGTDLEAVRESIARDGSLTRQDVNRLTTKVRRIVCEGMNARLVPDEAYLSIAAVTPLRPGQLGLRDQPPSPSQLVKRHQDYELALRVAANHC